MHSDFGGHDAAEGLTPLHPRIHSTATPTEVEEAQVEAFLSILADIAMAVAQRHLVERAGDAEDEA